MSHIINFPIKKLLYKQIEPENAQLELPFCEVKISIIPIEDMYGATVNNKICEIKPDIAIDLRYINIFNFPGTNKKIIFESFRKLNAKYKSSPFSWHNVSQKDFMSLSNEIINQLDEDIFNMNYKTILLIVPKKENELMTRIYINKKSSSYNKKIKII